jgi:hypothetical protein
MIRDTDSNRENTWYQLFTIVSHNGWSQVPDLQVGEVESP